MSEVVAIEPMDENCVLWHCLHDGAVAIEEFQRPHRATPGALASALRVVLLRIAIVDRDRNLLEARAKDVLCQWFIHVPAVSDENGKIVIVTEITVSGVEGYGEKKYVENRTYVEGIGLTEFSCNFLLEEGLTIEFGYSFFDEAK